MTTSETFFKENSPPLSHSHSRLDEQMEHAANVQRTSVDVLRAQGMAYIRFAIETPELYRLATMEEWRPGSHVATVLAGYAERRVFQGFSRGPASRAKASFQIAWHRGRVFELAFEVRTSTLRLSELLTGVPADSSMYGDLKDFIRSRQSDDLPDHRRLDPRKIQIRTYNRSGNIMLVVRITDGDNEYAVRKLVHLINEIYLTFLADGKYFDYLVETFNLDPDRM